MVCFKELLNLYLEDHDFVKAWKACTVHITLDRMKWLDFIIQDDRSSMRDNLIKEKHSGGLSGNFDRDKSIAFVVENYY